MQATLRRLWPVIEKAPAVIYVTVVTFKNGQTVEAPRRTCHLEADSFARLYAKLETVSHVEIIMPDGTTRLYHEGLGV